MLLLYSIPLTWLSVLNTSVQHSYKVGRFEVSLLFVETLTLCTKVNRSFLCVYFASESTDLNDLFHLFIRMKSCNCLSDRACTHLPSSHSNTKLVIKKKVTLFKECYLWGHYLPQHVVIHFSSQQGQSHNVFLSHYFILS